MYEVHIATCRVCESEFSMMVPAHVIRQISMDHRLRSCDCCEMTKEQREQFLKRICPSCYDSVTTN